MSEKIFRIGHRTPNKGVITIASVIENGNIYYGVSYCSPKEKSYSKQLGINMSRADLLTNGKFVELHTKKHSIVICDIITQILNYDRFPDWAEALLLEQLHYPYGLVRYSSPKETPSVEIEQIVVDSEFSKAQLLLASEYLHDLVDLDTDFMAVNLLAHLYRMPELIVVK
jgi:hypothetical protein